MSLWSDDRAAAIQVGAIVLFAFVILAITAYQASVVPGQNKNIEYNHNQRVQSQLQELEGAIGSMPATQDDRTVTVDLSTSYPARTIFINPPPPTGRLETLGTRNDTIAFEVQNATATNPDVADFWDGTTQNYSTGALAYTPNYNVYNQAPVTVVENSLVYNEFANARLRSNAQSLFDGKSISLMALRGSLSENGGTASVNVRPVSASTTTVPVRATGTDNVTISIVSRLSPREWNETLADAGELANQSGYVANVSGNVVGSLDGNNVYRVNFTMVRGQTYDLQLARVAVGELSTGERTTNASYAITVTETVTTEEDTNATVTFAVRDQYGNPKSGVSVNATVDGSAGTIADSPQTTDENGRVTFTYNTTDDISGASSETDTVQVSFSGDPATGTFDESAPENVTAEVTVKNTDGSGTGSGAGNYDLQWDITYIENQNTYAECYGANETCVYNISESTSDSLEMRVNTTPVTSEVFVDFGHNNSTIVKDYTPSEGVTDSGGYLTTTLAFENGDPKGTVELLASTIEDPETWTLKVVGVGSGGGSTSADNVALSSEAVKGKNGQTVEFTLQNSGSTSAEITDIEINSATGPAERVELKNGAELSGSNGGSLNQLLNIDGTTYALDTNALIPAGSSSTITLTDFQKPKPNGSGFEDADMNGETVVITIYYADGSAEEFTLTL